MGIIGAYRSIATIPDLTRAIEYFLDDQLAEFGSTTGRDLDEGRVSFCLDEGVGDVDILVMTTEEGVEHESGTGPGLSADEEDLVAAFHDSGLDIGEAIARLQAEPAPTGDETDATTAIGDDRAELLDAWDRSTLTLAEAIRRMRLPYDAEPAKASKLSRDERHLLAAWKATGLGLEDALLALDDKHSR